MSRVQLAINVSDIDQSVEFYSRIFDAEPAKRRPGYANFAIENPPLKLVLIESAAAPTNTLNHLGVEVEATSDVIAATQRFQEQGDSIRLEEGVECCFALQDKVWVKDPDGAEWEFYTVLGDAEQMDSAECCADADTADATSSCCA